MCLLCNYSIRKVKIALKRQSEAGNLRKTYNTTAKRKRTSSDLQNTTQKTKDWVPWISPNIGVNSCAPEGLTVSDPLLTPVVLLLHSTNTIWYGNPVGRHYALINTNDIIKTWTPDKTNGSKYEQNLVLMQ